jgi:single-stranded DNA-binding protein
MADTQYVSAEGFIQFDPVTRDANGQEVVDVTIRTPGTDGVLIRVTIWPELQGTELEKGDWIAADGKLNVGSFTGRDGSARQSIQISANYLAVVKGEKKAERAVVNAGGDADAPLF